MSESSSTELFLLCMIGSTAVAFPAAKIEAVVKLEHVTAVPGAPKSIRGLAAIRSRILTLIDCPVMVGVDYGDPAFMAVVTIDGHGYGLLLDSVADVVEMQTPAPVPAKLGASWSSLSPLLGEHAEELCLVIEPEQFVSRAGQYLSVAA